MKSLIDHLSQNIQDILIKELEDLGKEYQIIKKPFHIDENKYPYMHKYILLDQTD